MCELEQIIRIFSVLQKQILPNTEAKKLGTILQTETMCQMSTVPMYANFKVRSTNTVERMQVRAKLTKE